MKKFYSLLVALLFTATLTCNAVSAASTEAEALWKSLTSIVNLILTSSQYKESEKSLVKSMISKCAENHKNPVTKEACEIVHKDIINANVTIDDSLRNIQQEILGPINVEQDQQNYVINDFSNTTNITTQKDISWKLTAEEQKLYNVMMEYRATKGLPSIPLSTPLTIVAQTHVKDMSEYFLSSSYYTSKWCNAHSRSDKGNRSPVCYTDDHAQAKGMREKPRELTSYQGNGYEIAYWSSTNVTAEGALAGWKQSAWHNAVIIEEGNRNDRKDIGIGIHGSFATVWFGGQNNSSESNNSSNTSSNSASCSITANHFCESIRDTSFAGCHFGYEIFNAIGNQSCTRVHGRSTAVPRNWDAYVSRAKANKITEVIYHNDRWSEVSINLDQLIQALASQWLKPSTWEAREAFEKGQLNETPVCF